MSPNRRNSAALALGSAVSGVLAYLVFAITTRALGASTAAPVSVLWSYWAFAGAAFTFPLQHWVTRTVVAHHEGAVRAALPRISLVIVTASLVLGGLAWLARDDLFGRPGAAFPLMVSLVTLGSALIGLSRGALSARGRFTSVATSLVAENAIRCLTVSGLLVAGVRSPYAYGLCLVAGHLAVLLWPSALTYSRQTRTPAATGPLSFLAGAGLGQLIAQVALTGGPVLLALTGGVQSQVTTLFAALALFRAPYIVAMGLVAPLSAHASRLAAAGQRPTLDRMRSGILGATAASVVVAAPGGAWVGPALLRLVFGDDIVLGRDSAAIIAVGCTLAVASLVLGVVVTATNRVTVVARAWLVAVAAGAVTFALMPGVAAFDRTLWTFLVVEIAALGALVLLDIATTGPTRHR